MPADKPGHIVAGSLAFFRLKIPPFVAMKTPISLTWSFLLSAGSPSAVELAEADREWSQAVEKMFNAGKTSVTTPLEHRAQLARKIARKLGCRGEITRTENGFKFEIRQAAHNKG